MQNIIKKQIAKSVKNHKVFKAMVALAMLASAIYVGAGFYSPSAISLVVGGIGAFVVLVMLFSGTYIEYLNRNGLPNSTVINNMVVMIVITLSLSAMIIDYVSWAGFIDLYPTTVGIVLFLAGGIAIVIEDNNSHENRLNDLQKANLKSFAANAAALTLSIWFWVFSLRNLGSIDTANIGFIVTLIGLIVFFIDLINILEPAVNEKTGEVKKPKFFISNISSCITVVSGLIALYFAL